MNISTKIDEINNILNDYTGDQARIWLFDITHTKLAIKINSKQKQDIIYLVMSGCKYLKGAFSLNNPKFFVSQYYDHKALETISKIIDENSDFELSSTTGIALAKGLESEFGDSFEGFLKE
ncbi:hypothetical protein QWT87_14040 [Chryseobacterium sp. APV1]|uniref:Uncharacterized protein n=1 Tax=Chryseobacterium urinae TaxID=3058400 RepID=A0ABT8U4M9_9FLAO|nr:hypothetical protein [Chryseobacterium sp. APV1]MDO3426017.1 hypothetical protein [Chryseobacterium sp. APV1]